MKFSATKIMITVCCLLTLAASHAVVLPISGATKVVGGDSHMCALVGSGVKCWGDNALGQLGNGTTSPSVLAVDVQGLTSGVATIAAFGNETCALTVSGGVKCWGDNSAGQLGNGTLVSSTAVDVTGLSSGVSAITVGDQFACALTIAGGMKCWGGNDSGQLGDGSQTSHTTPTDVLGLAGGVKAISAGGIHTCALTNVGGVKCWGKNQWGQVGNGTNNTQTTPTDVVGLGSGIAAIGTGVHHACAITQSGGLKCWGRNIYGELGDGTITSRSVPGDVIGATSGVTTFAGGAGHSCALIAGRMKCWGRNVYSEVGDNSFVNQLIPVDVQNLGATVTSIGLGYFNSCALFSGAIRCWGNNGQGELADGKAKPRMPTDVKGLTSGVSTIATGFQHTCVLTNAGEMKCWGDNQWGQLGDNTQVRRLAPVTVLGLNGSINALSLGGGHSCALTANGSVKCWGANGYGELGDGTTNRSSLPVATLNLGSGVQSLSSGSQHACAVTANGGVKCWGDNRWGQVGDGSTTQRNQPVDVVGLSSGVKAVAVNGNYSCALTNVGGVKCWGNNASGQLGNNTTTDSTSPVDVIGLASGVVSLAASGEMNEGDSHTCALMAGGALKCWGNNTNGQLGDGTTTNRLIPVDITAPGVNFQSIITSVYASCALTTTGEVKCWGDNSYGELADETYTQRLTPVDVHNLNGGASLLVGTYHHACVITTSGGAKCWGADDLGQLGDGATWVYSAVPVTALMSTSAKLDHTCAILPNATAQCWGANAYGQLGDGTQTDRATPVTVVGSANIKRLATGLNHSCAVLNNGTVQCWGEGSSGQLGNGNGTSSTAPVVVTGISTATDIVTDKTTASSCALLANGNVQCWGDNYYGQLGDGTNSNNPAPVTVKLSGSANSLALNGGHACATLSSGSMQCWGKGISGELGNQANIVSNVPLTVVGISTAQQASAGDGFSCVRLSGGSVQCWGSNSNGRLGFGSIAANSLTPTTVVFFNNATQLASGSGHSCVRLTDNSLRCWGMNRDSTLGDGSADDRYSPVTVRGIGNANGLQLGNYQSCATLSTGSMQCWGSNDAGQLGNGTLAVSALPQTVVNTGATGPLALAADGSKPNDATQLYFVLAEKKGVDLTTTLTDDRIQGGIEGTVYFTGLLPADSPLLANTGNRQGNQFADGTAPAMVPVSFGKGGVKQTGPGIVTPPAATGTLTTGNNFTVYSGAGRDPLAGSAAIICIGITVPDLSAKGQVLMRPIATGDKASGVAQCPTVQTTATSAYVAETQGNLSNLALVATVTPSNEDRNQVRNVYSWAVAPDGRQFMQTGENQWEMMRDPMVPAKTLTVPKEGVIKLPVVAGFDLTSLAGTLVYVGMGSSWEEVKALNKAAQYYTLK